MANAEAEITANTRNDQRTATRVGTPAQQDFQFDVPHVQGRTEGQYDAFSR